MHLTEEPSEVVDPVDRVGREHHVARGGGDVAQIGEVRLEALDLHLVIGGATTRLGDAFGVTAAGRDRITAPVNSAPARPERRESG